MEQLTKEQAIALYESGEWKNWNSEQIVKLQLFQDLLCVDFSAFHKAMEDVLGRPVFTHEFAFRDTLIEECFGCKPTPDLSEILALIPADKLITIGLPCL